MKVLRYFVLMLAVVLCGNIFAQKSQKDLEQISRNHGEYYFSLTVQKPAEIQAISDFCSVDNFDGKNQVTCYANHAQYENLLKHGYQPTLMMPPSLQFKVEMWDGNDRAEYDWDAYPTYEAYEAMMFQFGTDHPDKCEILTLGTLASGRKIMVARLNNGQPEGKPKFLYTSTIHGDETTGWIMMLRLIDYLLENPDEPEVQNVMDNIDLYICPNANPDGTYHGGNNGVNGATRGNANGVDMNRNYPDRVDGAHPDGNPYQMETQWFMQLAEENAFVMGANYHGGSEVVNYPWDNDRNLHVDDAWYRLISREYADLCHAVSSNYMTDLNNGITNGAQWYMIGGGRQDYMNAYHQCREVTIECSGNKTVPGPQLPNYWNYNKNSIFAFMNQCLNGIHGTVTDKDTHEPLEATVTIESHDTDYSFVSSHLPYGDYHRPIKGGTYQVTYACNGYYPQTHTVTVTDGEAITLDVELEAGEGIIPDFNATTTSVALGSSVNFTDNTWGLGLVSWEWAFEGGEPSTSNVQNPTGITYNQVGTFDVTLTVTNSEGQTETVTKQNYITVAESYNMQNGTIETCNALFYDAQGPNANYGNNQNYTMTFRPAGEGNVISVNFLEFNTESGYDFLYIYDGSSTNATQIGRYSGSDSPGEVTATNAEGTLTFRFTSDQSVNGSGWTAQVSCVGDYEPMIIEVTANPEVINEGETSQLNVVAMGGAGGYTYAWEPVETLDNPNIANPVATPVDPETTYKVIVTDAEGNTETGEVTVTIRNLSVNENATRPSLYPNPTKGSFTLQAQGEVEYQLFNSLGQLVGAGRFNGGSHRIDAEHLNQGVYFLNIRCDAGNFVEKVVIE